MTGLSLLIAVPIGVCAAIFLVEYANNSGKVVGIIRITAETLSGIPSIVYGLFGMLFFTTALHWGLSVLSGAFTMAIMILPLIMRTSEEALKSVPDSYREASFGPWRGKTPHHFQNRSSGRHAGRSFRHHSGYGTCCGRNSGADVHGRYGGAVCGAYGRRTYPLRFTCTCSPVRDFI